MTDWGWVTLAHVVVYGTLGTYAALLTARVRRARRALQRR